jgi:hypothetical protein
VLPHAPLHSLALCHALSHSATHPWAAFPHFTPCPPGPPIHLIPLSFLVTTCTLVPGPLGHLVYKPCNYTLLPQKRNPVAFSPHVSDLSELSVALPLYSQPCCTSSVKWEVFRVVKDQSLTTLNTLNAPIPFYRCCAQP